ncbi:hypothetical protein J8L70_07530 [Pseudoalteromonas sp. MMG010]|uniref:poly-gamma-glutamate biosynthesis protein PgsC/CapC n=1 Tax=Pseudoalteromonas sp. MMG010 TaxID=2822685 RepID=UPI001B3A3B46|nr:poly-gamma-glutamate biosynthesis protein PgsC/CapC [Pseudoalteromonas sp. MMG010]MBQ4833087.1 hypothetical protein [Pseudoalteromonas sp. MMG010]
MGDLILNFFPAGGGLGQSVITTVWVGVAVVCFLNLRFGFPLTGLVVPGYIVPLLIVSPTSAVVILIEAIVVYVLMRLSAKYAMEKFGYAEMFGRDRFFAIILISILVRVLMDTLFWPFVATFLSSWDITFDYSSQLYSLGLVIIALTANVMWNGGFRYGMKVTLIQLLVTFLIVRFILMGFTNFSIANLAIMYEDVAVSIIAAPKAYIILVITAFIASRANLKYGWEFNGIMLPALLALQLMQPSKLLTSFAETAIILIIGASLLNFTRLKHANIEGARLLLLFFNIGFIYKLILNYGVIYYFPQIKVTDTFAFGYMLATLLALKIYQKNALGLVVRATFQTSVLGGSLAIVIGFFVMFIPSLFTGTDEQSITQNKTVTSLSQQISEYKSFLYIKDNTKIDISSYQSSQNRVIFKQAIYELNKAPNSEPVLQKVGEKLAQVQFQLLFDENNIYIRDTRKDSQRGFFVIARKPNTQFVVSVPYPTSESIASDSAGLIYSHYNAKALVFGTSLTPTLELNDNNTQSPFYLAFIEALNTNELFQVRESNTKTNTVLQQKHPLVQSQYWIYNQLPDKLSQRAIANLLGSEETFFGVATPHSLPSKTFTGAMFELFLNSDNYVSLLANLNQQKNSSALYPINVSSEPIEKIIQDFSYHITTKGSGDYTPLTLNDAALWEFEILVPLYRIKRQLDNNELSESVKNQLNQVNSTLQLTGYQLTLVQNKQGRFLLIAPQDNPNAYKKGQGLYLFNLNIGSKINLEVPRPIFESNTLRFAGQLYLSTNAEHLLIAGAHPYAQEEANLLAPHNVNSLFNVIHQSYLRFLKDTPVLNLQVRSHSAPSWVRPSALAFQFTQINPEHNHLLTDLEQGLEDLSVNYELVAGQKSTRGLELGTSPQSGYQIFSPYSELATLWLASDFKENFSINKSSLIQRLLAVSNTPDIVSFNPSTLSPDSWQSLNTMQKDQLKEIINNYATTQRVGSLLSICENYKSCSLQTIQLEGQGTYALVIKAQGKLLAIFNPLTNHLTDSEEFASKMRRGDYVIN